ncbi:1-phosphofructokinase [Stutzerimonas urumqiensis]|uniref:1-phosphofructokinase n=1 Tax=Stutzerimonas urumqiensis TaxID=638269 RepID=UPI003BAB615A
MAKILTVTLNPALDLTVRLPTLRPGEVNRGEALHVQAAGKGLNVAQVLADLGHALTVTGFLGADNPQPFEALFAARGFDDRFIRVPGQTRSNLKLAEADGRVTDINGPGLMIDPAACDALLARLDATVPGHAAVVVAGSLPRGIDHLWFGHLLGRIALHGVPIALDTSGPALAAGLRTRPWLAKPNLDELAEVSGRALDDEAVLTDEAARLLAAGVTHLVVSRGADGVSWFSAEGQWRSTPPRVQVVSTVGAGDSLLAGMLHGLLEGWPPERTLRQATAIAAQAVAQIDFGIIDRAHLADLDAATAVQALGPNKNKG